MNGENKKLLVVDDEPVARKVINFALRNHGYTVFESGTPQDALQKLNMEDIDLVFCDVMMDDMDGFEFCKIVRKQEKYNALPFIFITAMNSSEARSKAFDSGADDFITKPVNSEELLGKTEALLKRIEIYKTYGLKKKFDDVYEKKVHKVLIVDDDPVIVKLLRNALVKLNFDCKIENNARDGFDAVKSYSPDIILSDYDMPEISGFELFML